MMKVIWRRGVGFTIPGGFTNQYLTSDGRLPRRVHFCVSAHKNSNNKHTCLDKGSDRKNWLWEGFWVRVCDCVCVWVWSGSVCVSVCLCSVWCVCCVFCFWCVLCVVCCVSCVFCMFPRYSTIQHRMCKSLLHTSSWPR
jgi:hypothetical protein